MMMKLTNFFLLFAFLLGFQKAVSKNSCGEPPDADNANVVVNETSTPFVTAEYSCNETEGYVLQGNNTIFCVPVFSYSIWSSINFTCNRVRCQGYPQIENSTSSVNYLRRVVQQRQCTYRDRDYRRYGCYYGSYIGYIATYQPANIYYNGGLVLTCEPGHQFPDNSTTAWIACGVKGEWIYPNVSCHPKDCGHLPKLTGVDCEETSTVYPSEISCTCEVGYERNTTDTVYELDRYGNRMRDMHRNYKRRYVTDNYYTRSCTTDGVWSEPNDRVSANCTRVFCPGRPKIPKSIEEMTVVNGYRYGDTMTYFCIPGYESKINTTVRCEGTRYWSTLPICIRKDCGYPLPLPNGHIKVFVVNTKYEAVVPYGCNVGFNMIGANYSRCGEEGTWSALPICHRIRCDEPPSVAHSKRTVMGHYYNDATNYLCDIGYTLAGNASIYCQFDGHWTAKPECHAKSCGAPPTVNHATITIRSGFQFGDVVDYQCGNAFVLIGVPFITCLSTGNWSFAPICSFAAITQVKTATNAPLLPKTSPFTTPAPSTTLPPTSQRITFSTSSSTQRATVKNDYKVLILQSSSQPSPKYSVFINPLTTSGNPPRQNSAKPLPTARKVMTQESVNADRFVVHGKPESSESHGGLLAGLIVLTILVVFIIAGALLYLVNKYRRRREHNFVSTVEPISGETMTLYSFKSSSQDD